jgi:hypothetical protein
MTIYDLVGAGFELNTSIAGLDFIARNHLGNVCVSFGWSSI